MKNNNNKLPTAEELRFAAKTMAYRVAESRGIDPNIVRHVIDTDYNHPCFVVSEDNNHARVIYDHDPEVEYRILNRAGRLQPIEQSVIPITDKVDQ